MDFLTRIEKQRYSRQILYPSWGGRAHHALKKASVFIAGAGGLGCPVMTCLAAAGVGCLRVCDQGEVEHSNLNRQILYSKSDLGTHKVVAAEKAVKCLNQSIRFEPLYESIDKRNIERLVAEAQLLIDCVDNFETRFVLNSYAVKEKIPLVHGGVSGFLGQITFVRTPNTPCLSCMIGAVEDSIGAFPIVGATAGIIGSLQALEALKYLTGTGELLEGRILFWDGERNRFHISREERNPDCPVCAGTGPDYNMDISR